VKRISVDDPRSDAPLEHLERVARFGLADFELMFAVHGLRIDQAYGDYGLGPFDADASPRLILEATKPARGYLRDRFAGMRDTVSGDTPRYEASMNCGTRTASEGYVFRNS